MYKLKVQKLHPDAILPILAHTGDSAYDLYAIEDTVIEFGKVTRVRTGIAAQAVRENWEWVGERLPLGLLVRDRSSMALKGLKTLAGVIDSGYTGEIMVLMTLFDSSAKHRGAIPKVAGSDWPWKSGYLIKAGTAFAQVLPHEVCTGEVEEVDCLEATERGGRGFGSSDKHTNNGE